jgi:isoleucyl-tRNA synthetase
MIQKFQKPEANPNFPELEVAIQRFWSEHDTFRKSVRDGGRGDYVFYDGPPFATGTPHYGHLLAGTLKDIVPRYWTMRGFRVERRFGWDTHGLPVEMEIEKDLGLQGPTEVLAYGVGRYNEACRAIVLRYTGEWRKTVERMGRWIDFDNDYKTMDPSFMESVWWVFRTLWDKGLIYRGHKVMPYSWRLGTPLSNFEAGMDYRSVQDPAVTVRFEVQQDAMGKPVDDKTFLLAWTTTPWTLPSNMGLCVGPDVEYVLASKPGSAERLILAQALADKVLGEHTVHATYKGSDLVGTRYAPVFDAYAEAAQDGAFRVVSDAYVTIEDGTGIVHQAPPFGEDDYRVALHWGLPLRDPVDAEGKFTGDLAGIAGGAVVGLHVKDADKLLTQDLKARGLLFKHDVLVHEYPFCWRSGTPLIYKAMPTWFVKVSELRERMVALNEQTRWVPEFVGEKRFANWLRDARDWAISRNRFWGTPLPVWQCTGCGHFTCIGSIADLKEKSGVELHDLHKHHADGVQWPCETCASPMQRVPEVLDCWFESGAMPYAQNHYPFENKEKVERSFPAEFIAEGLDQTRGWFYTLFVLATALDMRDGQGRAVPPFRNVIVNGLILAEDGQKMSKRLKNYPDPAHIFDTFGADALRAYLATSPAVRAEPMRFAEAGVREVVRSVLLPLWNAYSFFATYAAAEGWEPPQAASQVQDRALLDRWIVSVLQSLVRDVNVEMEAYRLYNVIPRVLGFIDDLTNWYIRRSRRRFWKNDDPRDHQHAFETLYEVLTTFARVLAPILPFMAELLYQRLEAGRLGKQGSVHLEAFPQVQEGLVDEQLEADMKLCRDVVRMGRSLREQVKIGIRQPLSHLSLAYGDSKLGTAAFVGSVEALVPIIQEELNLKNGVRAVQDVRFLVDTSVKANFKTLGKRLGGKMKPVSMAIAAAGEEQVRSWLNDQTIPIEGELIGPEDLIIERKAKPGLTVASEGTLTVALDTTITPELRAEGLAREVVSKVQNARKDTGLQVEDRIALGIWSGSEALTQAIDTWREYVMGETLAVRLELLPEPGDLAVTDAGGEPVAVVVRKVEKP